MPLKTNPAITLGSAADKKNLDFQYAVDYLRRFFSAATLKKTSNPQ